MEGGKGKGGSGQAALEPFFPTDCSMPIRRQACVPGSRSIVRIRSRTSQWVVGQPQGAAPLDENYCLLAGLGALPKPLVSPVSDRRIRAMFSAGATEGTFPFFSCNPTIRRYAICKP